MTYPSVYPTGTTIYYPDKCFNGYTVFQAKEHGALIIDMNGGEIKFYNQFHGFPNKLLKDGYKLACVIGFQPLLKKYISAFIDNLCGDT